MHSLQIQFEAIGTFWTIDCIDTTVPKQKVENAISSCIDSFERVFSRFRDDSVVSVISKKSGEYVFGEDTRPLFDLYYRLYKVSDGTFTPLIGNVLVEAGYDSTYSFTPTTLHRPPKWEDVLDYHFPSLTIKKPVVLDFGAAGKGFLVDKIGAILEELDVESYCVDAGGDILYNHKQKKPLRVGLEHPTDQRKVIGYIDLQDGSICASSGNRRAWGQYHHIIKPDTLSSPSDILSVWVTASNTMTADALATALFLAEAETLASHFSYEYLICYSDFSIKKSDGFDAVIFYG